MIRKLLVVLIEISFINFIGCSTYEVFNTKEIKDGTAQIDRNEEIFITTIDSSKYYFPSYGYQIVRDTLFGEGTIRNAGKEGPFIGKLAIDEIKTIEQSQNDSGATTGLIIGIFVVGIVAVGVLTLASIGSALISYQ